MADGVELAGGIARRSDRDLLLLATCAFMTGDYSLSATASDLLATRSPHDMAALYWSVKANEKLAFVAFGHFEQLKPDSERTHLLLGDMYRQRQRFEQAESEYRTASAWRRLTLRTQKRIRLSAPRRPPWG